MNKINKLLVITLVMGLMVVSAMHNDVMAQRDPGKSKVLERSKRFPRWAKGGWSRGKVFKQKKNSSKNTQLCSKGTAYWFVTDYEFQINRTYKSTGKPFNAPRQHAERLAHADLAASLVESIDLSIKTEVEDKSKYINDELDTKIENIINVIKAKKNVQGLLRVGSAWERISRGGDTYWKIHSWCSICKENYDKVIEDNAEAAGISDELTQKIIEGVTSNIEEGDAETDEYDDSDSEN